MEEEEKGISLGEIFRIVLKKIWLVLGVSALVAILAVLIVHFALNPAASVYKMDFRIIYPLSTTEKYPDGTPFYYDDIISKESLERAKATDSEKFASIDADSIIKGDKITISAETETVNGVKTLTGRYTIRLLGGAVTDRRTAEAFITAIAGLLVTDIQEKAQNVDFSTDEATYKSASFQERLTLLSGIKNRLINEYNQWINLYRETYPVDLGEEGKVTLSNLKSEVSSTFETTLAQLNAEFKFYCLDQIDLARAGGDLKKAVENARDMLEKRREQNQAVIDDLMEKLEELNASFNKDGSGNTIVVGDTSGFAELLAQYTKDNTEISTSLERLTYENAKKYEEQLNDQYDRLTGLAEKLTKVTASIYKSDTRVLFDLQTASVSGKTSIIIAAVAGFVLSFLVCSVAVCAADRRKRGRQQEEAQSSPAEEKEEQKENE